MAEYIERGALLAAYDKEHEGEPGRARKLIEDAPTADVQPVRHGRDISNEVRGHIEFKCSLCGVEIGVVEGGELDGGYFRYCPGCGAKMDMEANE